MSPLFIGITLVGSGTDATLPEQCAAGQQIGSLWLSLVLALTRLAVVVLGGQLLVERAIGTAKSVGLSATVIGLTIVAIWRRLT